MFGFQVVGIQVVTVVLELKPRTNAFNYDQNQTYLYIIQVTYSYK